MRVFVTGATGFIGAAIVNDLVAAGHEVLGLARSEASAERLQRLGVAVHRGELSETDRLAAGARGCDGVIHTAFIHDFSQYASAAETDRRAVAALIGALEGSGKPFVSTSGSLVLEPGRLGTEDAAPMIDNPLGDRAAAEDMVVAAAARGVRTIAVRLPPTVHGAGDHGFVPALIGIARSKGVSAYVADGTNRWPAVHRLDAARLFRLALEMAAGGTRLHGVAEAGVAYRAIAEVIGAGLGVPLRALTKAQAQEHFGWMANVVAIDNPMSSALTRSALGWNPQQPDLLTDVRESGYF